MKLAFYTNFMNHHQVHIADEFYRILGQDFSFIATIPMPESFKKTGYPNFDDRPYIISAYKNQSENEKALVLSEIADVVIVGDAPSMYYRERVKNNKIVFLYNERWFKTFQLGYLNPKLWIFWYKNFIKYRKQRFYMLCASAFTKHDVSMIGAFPNKCYKWGYFPQSENFNLESYFRAKRNLDSIHILWCARFIKWKRPEMMIKLALFLKAKKYNFQIKMIGNGDQYENIRRQIYKENLSDNIILMGNLPNSSVLEEMKKSHIFVFTSNKQEGWGAVLNEAMAAGCAVVASDQIGAAPYLIENKKNGELFKSGCQKTLNSVVDSFFSDKEKIYRYGRNAYITIQNEWSPYCAVHNFVELVESIISDRENPISSGPCSFA